MAFSGRPRGPARIRVAPPAHGAAAGGRAPGSRPAPLRFAPGPGPGPGRALRSAARPVAAPGPSPLYDSAAGPSRARSATSRDLRIARRSRGPRGVRCDAAGVRALRSPARPGRSWTVAALRAGSRAHRARTTLSRDPRFARRARAPGGPLRRRRRTEGYVTGGGQGGDADCVPSRVAPAGPCASLGVGGDWSPAPVLATPPGEPSTLWHPYSA